MSSARPARRKPAPRPAVAADRRASPPAGRASPPPDLPFDLHEFLETAGVARRIVEFRHDAVIYTQGVSQETLAEMVGTTRSRVNFFMNKFRRLGFVDYNGGIRINNSLLSVVLHD